MTTREISKRSLFMAAAMDALLTYRAAFKRGQLGEVHMDVVQRTYQLASDEFASMAQIERRRGRLMMGLALLAAGVDALALLALHVSRWSVADLLISSAVLTFMIASIDRYSMRGAYLRAARLLASPPRRVAPVERETTSL